MSKASVDLPEPLTPVTTLNLPRGMLTDSDLRLCSLALTISIRALFADAPLARQRSYTASKFSFNSGDGRCPTCGGSGFEHVEMQFLSDVYLRCPDCDGQRYRPEILEVTIERPLPARPGDTADTGAAGAARLVAMNVADVLDLTVAEAAHADGPAGDGGALLKVIVETALLDDDAIVLACEAAVEAGKEAIRDGEVFQVVLSQRLDLDCPASPLDVYRALRTINPSPYMYCFQLVDAAGREFAVVGSSPETLVKVDDGRVLTFPIAGSRPRGARRSSCRAAAPWAAASRPHPTCRRAPRAPRRATLRGWASRQ